MKAVDIANIYLERGEKIFPVPNVAMRAWRSMTGWFGMTHDRSFLEAELRRILRDELFETSKTPLCIPVYEGRFAEPYIFKTPHHPDYKRDGRERLVDGGIWANNPIMVGIVDALTCFSIDRHQLHVLSLGT